MVIMIIRIINNAKNCIISFKLWFPLIVYLEGENRQLTYRDPMDNIHRERYWCLAGSSRKEWVRSRKVARSFCCLFLRPFLSLIYVTLPAV